MKYKFFFEQQRSVIWMITPAISYSQIGEMFGKNNLGVLRVHMEFRFHFLKVYCSASLCIYNY